MRYVVVDDQTDAVVNATEWDGESEWSPGEGLTAHRSDVAQVGWLWNGGDPHDPNPPLIVVVPQDGQANFRAMQLATAARLSESSDLKDNIEGLEIRLRLLGG